METEKVHRIVLADDQTLYREGLRGLIEHWPEFEVVGDANNGREAVEVCKRKRPDIVLLDIQMPVMTGIEAARAIHEQFPDMIIVMLTVESSKDMVFDSLDAGVKGYFLKDTPARQLRSKLNGIVGGDMSLSDGITERVVTELTRLREAERKSTLAQVAEEEEADSDNLTERDCIILRLIAEGKSNEEIGAELFLSLGTVKKQIANIMQKLYLENRVQLAVYAVKHHLVD